MAATRGVRNNNPGNIDYNPANKWQGQLGIETGVPNPRFIRFSTPEYGIRAMCELLQTYARKYNANTIQKAVAKYAPAHENKTDKYIENVSKWSGIPDDKEYNPNTKEVLLQLIPAFIRQECGYMPYTPDVIERGILLSL